ncbi:ABC-2 family transporter protein [Streptomyces tricolor]|nr:ABC-2 family transporter protein [Streptomyces tricolor]
MGAQRLYAAVAAGGFRRYATYRAATAAGVFTNTVFGLILVYTYRALWDEKPHLGGYDQAQAVTYVWLGQAFLSTLAIGGGGVEDELMERIRTGDVAIDLYRPVDLQLWWLAADLGRAFFQLLGRGWCRSCSARCASRCTCRPTPASGPPSLLSVLLAMLVGFGIRYLVALSAFWLLDGTGVVQMAWLLGFFCSGMLLPLNVFPGALGEVVRALPWSSLLQAPADLLLGHGEPLPTYLFQAAWAVVLLGAGRLVQSAATRRVVVQGG